MKKLIIKGELPTMNEIVAVSKKHWSKYAQMKDLYTSLVALESRKMGKIDQKIDVVMIWYCKNKRKDKDNIMAGQKFLFDGLVKSGVVDGDGWKSIGDIIHRFEIDRKNPRIEVYLIEKGDGCNGGKINDEIFRTY